MNLGFLRYLFGIYKNTRRIKGYKNVFNSHIENIETIDHTAHIYDSFINGAVVIENDVRLSNVYVKFRLKRN